LKPVIEDWKTDVEGRKWGRVGKLQGRGFHSIEGERIGNQKEASEGREGLEIGIGRG